MWCTDKYPTRSNVESLSDDTILTRSYKPFMMSRMSRNVSPVRAQMCFCKVYFRNPIHIILFSSFPCTMSSQTIACLEALLRITASKRFESTISKSVLTVEFLTLRALELSNPSLSWMERAEKL